MANKPTKKTAAKKQTVKKTVKVAPEMVEEEIHTCGCGDKCSCNGKCSCHSGCGHTFKKIIIAAIIFALGFAAAQLLNTGCDCYRGKCPMAGYRMQATFVNGCLDTSAVKCPVLLEKLPAMDTNQDGCISEEEYAAGNQEYRQARDEMRKARQEMREEMRDMRDEVREEMREARRAMNQAF